MAITLVQKNGSASTGTLDATPPAWSSTTTAGNLLIIVGCEVNCTNATWPTAPSGYTAFTSNAFTFYAAGIVGVYGGYYKIAAGSDATPGHYGETTGTQDWVTYTYEFNNPLNWKSPQADQECHTAASSTQVTSQVSANTGTLAQSQELAILISAHDVAVTAESYTNSFTVDRPGTSNGKLWFGWKETSVTTALNSTASWTTLARVGVKIFTFKTVVPDPLMMTYPSRPAAQIAQIGSVL